MLEILERCIIYSIYVYVRFDRKWSSNSVWELAATVGRFFSFHISLITKLECNTHMFSLKHVSNSRDVYEAVCNSIAISSSFRFRAFPRLA